MKDKIETKINSIIDYIIAKPENEITMEDYNILASELRDIRFREQQSEQSERMAKLIAASFPGTMYGIAAYGQQN